MDLIGSCIPLIIVFIVITIGFVRKTPIFGSFKVGAEKGIKTTIHLLPTLIGIIISITMLTESGLIVLIIQAVAPVTDFLGFPSELVPLAVLKPISGSGANGIVISIFDKYGPDSYVGRIASILSSSTETTFYAIAVYFSVKNYKSLRYTVPVSLIGDSISIILSVLVINIFG